MSEDRDLECVPAHRTAFALRLSLEESHATEAEAVAEMARLRELIEALWQERNLQAA